MRTFATVAVILAVCYAGWWIIWAWTASPSVTMDSFAQLQQIAHDAQSPGENGWEHIDRARSIYDDVEVALDKEGRPPVHADSVYYGMVYDNGADDWDLLYQGDRDEALAFALRGLAMLRERDIFTPLIEARLADHVVEPQTQMQDPGNPQPLWTSALFPRLSSDRMLGQALRAEMRLARMDGDPDRAVRAAEAGLSLAYCIAMQPTIIEYLIGVSIARNIRQEIMQWARDEDIAIEYARTLIRIQRETDLTVGMHTSLDGEMLYFRDLMQFIFSDDGDGDGVMLVSALCEHNIDLAGGFARPQRGPRLLNLLGPLFASRREMLARIETTLGRMHELVELPYQHTLDFIEAAEQSDGREWRFALYDTLASHFPSQLRQTHDDRAFNHGIQILLAIEGYRSEHRRLPRSLDELVPEWFTDLPDDPYSSTGFVYRVFDRPDEHGRTYILYSVYFDGGDQGGQPRVPYGEHGDLVFTPAGDQ